MINAAEQVQSDETRTVKTYQAKFFAALVKEKDLEKQYNAVKAERLLMEEVLYTAMLNVKWLAIKASEGTYTRGVDLYSSFADKEKGYAWLRDEGFDALITETVNATTFSAHIRRLIKDDSEFEIPEFVNANPVHRIRFRKKGGWK